VGEGLSDLNIATRLRISEHTVAAHLRSVFGKLALHSRAELASLAPLLRGSGFKGRSRGGR
jgi:DNA-binding CsgD family transcriptional regulator